MTPDFSTPYGLGNRVTAMANGLSRASQISFRWIQNIHCPAAVDDVFPAGIPGVTIVPTTEPFRPLWVGPYMIHQWDAAADRDRANAAYRIIMESMIGAVEPGFDVPRIGVFGRFYRAPEQNPMELAARAIRACRRYAADGVFLLSDRHREEIASLLADSGIRVVMPRCRNLAEDLERSARDIVDYAGDWHMLTSVDMVVSTNGPASALHPIRAAGIPICYGTD